MFLTILSHKAESAGRELIAVEPRDTSRTCARCGHRAKENRVTQAEFACTACGHAAHADVNAAVNILRAGLALRELRKRLSEKPLPSGSGGVTEAFEFWRTKGSPDLLDPEIMKGACPRPE